MNDRSTKKRFAIALVLAVMGLAWWVLSRSGVCLSTMRRLSTHESMHAVFDEMNKPGSRTRTEAPGISYVKVPYADFATYAREHPECCRPEQAFVEPKDGGDVLVGILYHARWRAPDGTIEIEKQTEVRTPFLVSACGTVTRWP